MHIRRLYSEIENVFGKEGSLKPCPTPIKGRINDMGYSFHPLHYSFLPYIFALSVGWGGFVDFPYMFKCDIEGYLRGFC